MNAKQITFLLIGTLIMFPVHEYGHWMVANSYDIEIKDISYFPFPQITVDEFEFEYPYQFVVYYLAGMSLPMLFAVPYALIVRPTKKLSVVYLWFTLAPVSALTDFSNLFRVFSISDYTKWIHFILGMYLMYRIERIIARKNFI